MAISKGWLSKILECTPEGRKKCKGYCCCNHSSKIKEHETFVRYSKAEYQKLPPLFKKHVGKDRIVKTKNGACALIPLCLKYPEHKPTECKLAPLTITKGRLVLQYGAICGGCPNFKKGDTPLYTAMKDNIIDIFGISFYERLLDECTKR